MADKLQQAIAAIKAGDKATGRKLLIEVLEGDPRNESAWLWMTGVVQSRQDRLRCLHQILKINPDNQIAKQAVAQLQGQTKPASPQVKQSIQRGRDSEESVAPPQPKRRLSWPVWVGIVSICVLGITGAIVALMKGPELFWLPTATIFSTPVSARPTETPLPSAEWLPGPTLTPDVRLPEPTSRPVVGGDRAADGLIWKFRTEGPVQVSPMVEDGIVYVANASSESLRAILSAVDAETGREIWRFETRSHYFEPIAVADGVLFITSGDHLYAVDALSSSVHWRLAVDRISGLPAFADGVIYVGSLYDGLYAIDTQTQQVLWQFDPPPHINGSVVVANDTVYCSNQDGGLHAVDLRTGAQKWYFETGGSISAGSAPVVAGGTVYIGSYQGDFYALDSETGEEEWVFQTRSLIQTDAAVDETRGLVLIGTAGGSLYALDAQTGEERWVYRAPGSVSSGPTVADGVAYFGAGGGGLYAVDVETGQALGRFQTYGLVLSPPTIVDGTVYFGSTDGNLYAVDLRGFSNAEVDTAEYPEKGMFRADAQRSGFYDTVGVLEPAGLRWRVRPGDYIVASPALVDGVLHYGSLAIRARSGELVWRYSDFGGSIIASSPAVSQGIVYYGDENDILHAIDSTTGEKIWDLRLDGALGITPLVVDGILYCGCPDGSLRALDAQTGEEIWVFQTEGGTSVPAFADGAIYFSSADGFLYAVDSQTGQEKWRIAAGGGGDESGFASPAIANGIVYVTGADGHLYAVDGQTGSEKWRLALEEGDSELSSPAVDGKTVFVANAYGFLYAVDAETGQEIWRLQTDEIILSSPSIAEGIVYIGTGYPDVDDVGYLYAVDGQTGEVRWRFSASPILASPVVFNGVVYFSDADGNIYALEDKRFREPPSAGTPETAHSDGAMHRANLSRTGVYDTRGPSKLGAVKWQFEAEEPGMYAPPTIAGNTIYVGSGSHMYALDIETGQRKWSFMTSGAFSSPAVADGVVYFGSYGGYLYAVDTETGQEIWRFVTRGFPYEEDVMASTPAVSNGVVYVGSYDGYLYAVDSQTGQEVWAFKTGGLIHSSPAIADGVVYFGSGDYCLYAVDARTGQEVWRFGTRGPIAAIPAVADGAVYIQDAANYVYAVDTEDGQLIWEIWAGGATISSPAVDAGLVYVGTKRGLYALDSQTGEQRWGVGMEEPVESSPVVADGVVYFGSNGGYLYAADGQTGEILWWFKTGENANPSPVVADGIVYAFGDGYLYALSEDVPEGATAIPSPGPAPITAAAPLPPPFSPGPEATDEPLPPGTPLPTWSPAYNQPGTYTFEDKCETVMLSADVAWIMCVESVVVRPDGYMQFNISWTAYFLPGSAYDELTKFSDEGNPNMYVVDNLGNRYDHVALGGTAAEDVTFRQYETVEGWYLFPPAQEGAVSFTFHDDDLDASIQDIVLLK